MIPTKLSRFSGAGAISVAVFLVGCATAPPRISPFAGIEPFDDTPPTEPLALPDYPEFTVAGETASVTAQGAQTLLIYRETAEANTEIAWQHAQQILELRKGYNALARAGQAEHEIAELRQTRIEDERRAHVWARITDWILIGILGLAAAR